jgi:hypothetical protein
LDAEEKEGRVLFLAARAQSQCVGKRSGDLIPGRPQQLHSCSCCLSVTADPQVSDNDKTRNGQHPTQDAGRCEAAGFNYGVISQTTPQPQVLHCPVPPTLAVP